MKLTGTKKILGGIALAGAMAITGVVGVAQQQQKAQDGGKDRAGWSREGREGRKGRQGMEGKGFGGRFAEKLNLTDAQKQQIEQIKARFQESTKALRQQERGNREKDFDAFSGGAFNESAVRAAAQARANVHVEMEVAHARMMSEIYNILTPEQKAQLAQERQQREQRRQQWRANRGGQVEQN